MSSCQQAIQQAVCSHVCGHLQKCILYFHIPVFVRCSTLYLYSKPLKGYFKQIIISATSLFQLQVYFNYNFFFNQGFSGGRSLDPSACRARISLGASVHICKELLSLYTYMYRDLGKPHFKKCRVYLGIAQIAIAPPPPFTQTGTLGHFISGPT